MKIRNALITKIACIIVAGWLLYQIVLISGFLIFSVQSDVAKRIQSPDKSKIALLVRRSAFIDLNFVVKVKTDHFYKTIHFSRDFMPALSDWNEKLIWSDDSSFVVMMVNDINQDNETYMWAYDFNNNKEYSDNVKVIEILDSRNSSRSQSEESSAP